jgi:hypothetical protein
MTLHVDQMIKFKNAKLSSKQKFKLHF